MKASKYLDTPILRKKYLQACFKDFNAEMFVSALGDVVEAEGIEDIAQRIGVKPSVLQKTFKEGAHPSYAVIHHILKTMNIRLR